MANSMAQGAAVQEDLPLQGVQASGDGPLPISVIIPTYNRRAWLEEILESIALQSLGFEQFEVIIVDDGSTDDTREVLQRTYPFAVRYFYQTNQGDAAARNLGAQQSHAEILVFLDDDILLDKDFLAEIWVAQRAAPNRIIVGADILWVEETNPLVVGAVFPAVLPDEPSLVPLPFAEVCSNNMSIRREAYFAIGMMEGLDFPGSSMWCDVDFAYRAYQQQYDFFRHRRALCWHRDYVAKSFESRKKRMYEVAFRAVVLFHKYPELVNYLPMFADKTPVVWKQDTLGLIVRKLLRPITSSRFVIWMMEKWLKMVRNQPGLAWVQSALGRWIVGGYIFRGYHAGVRKFGPRSVSDKPGVFGSVENNS
jgi:glycosyltransferase involved in cell wall biosynthesis